MSKTKQSDGRVITLRIDAALHQRIRDCAQRDGQSMNTWLRERVEIGVIENEVTARFNAAGEEPSCKAH